MNKFSLLAEAEGFTVIHKTLEQTNIHEDQINSDERRSFAWFASKSLPGVLPFVNLKLKTSSVSLYKVHVEDFLLLGSWWFRIKYTNIPRRINLHLPGYPTFSFAVGTRENRFDDHSWYMGQLFYMDCCGIAINEIPFNTEHTVLGLYAYKEREGFSRPKTYKAKFMTMLYAGGCLVLEEEGMMKDIRLELERAM